MKPDFDTKPVPPFRHALLPRILDDLRAEFRRHVANRRYAHVIGLRRYERRDFDAAVEWQRIVAFSHKHACRIRDAIAVLEATS